MMEEKIRERFEKLSDVENYKQINDELDSGKKFMIDYNDSKVECDLYGMPLIKYNSNITGQQSYKSRLSKGFIKKIKYGEVQYIPQTNRLLGGSMSPRPLAMPFVNNKIKGSNKLIETIKSQEYYKIGNNKKIFNLKEPKKNPNALPSYFNSKLAKDSPKTRKHLINLFDEYIEIRKKELRNDPNCYSKDGQYRGLMAYKNILQNNLTKNIFNGNKVRETEQKDIKDNFKIIQKLIKVDAWNSIHLERENINHDNYKKLYDIIGKVEAKNKSLQKSLSTINSLELRKKNEIENKKGFDGLNNNEIQEFKGSKINNRRKRQLISALVSPRSDDNNTQLRVRKGKSRQKIIYDSSVINNNNTNNKNENEIFFSFQSNEKKSSNKFESTSTTGFFHNNMSAKSRQFSPKISNLYSPRIFPNNSSLINIYPNQNKEIFNTDNKVDNKNTKTNEGNERKVKFEEIDNLSEKSYIGEIGKKKRIKKLDEIKEKCEHENELLKGFQEEVLEFPDENNGIKMKKRAPNFISPDVVYGKEIEMFKKVNPIQYDRERRKKILDDKILLKKLNNRRIYERIKIKK